MLRFLPFVLLAFMLSATGFSQRNCGSMDVLQQEIESNPARQIQLDKLERFTEGYLEAKEFANGVITIPVIVHVVYTSSSENISDAQIQSQIDVLNDDFRRTNGDRTNTPSVFSGVAADTEIEFCLIDVIRVSSSQRRGFGTNDAVKQARRGSVVVTPESAMNMWVCNIGGGILGYAQFPGGSPSTDGIVVDYRYFGTIGTATAPFNLGRTATHEVGHYLNLRHIWGDTGCGGDDFVSDTPLAGGPNYTGGACSFPGPNSCTTGSGDLPDMFQNYMDYSDDGCMNLFTTGQKNRMIAAINAARPGLLSGSCGGTPPVVDEICDNGIDDDGDGQIDCADGDCATASNCDNPPAVEICDNGIDDDGDGQIDCADGDCATATNCDDPPTGGCDAPTGLSNRSRKGGREQTFSWNSVGGASSYEIEIFTGGQSAFTTSLSGTSINVSGFTRGASYTWRVRANCGSNGISDWSNGSFNARLAQQLLTASPELVAFPNPTSGREVSVNWDLASDKLVAQEGVLQVNDRKVTVSLSDISGRTLIEQDRNGDYGSTSLDVTELPRGVFVVRVVAEDGYSVSTKLVKL